MKHTVAFRHKLVVLPKSENPDKATALAVIAELLQFGFAPDLSAIEVMTNASKEDLVDYANEVIAYLRKNMGATHSSYTPLWAGFPEEVMAKSETELWEAQLTHYGSNGTFLPNEWTETRPTAFEQPSYIVYKGGTQDEFDAIFTSLVSGNNSLTPQDTEDVKWFVKSKATLKMPDTIPFKENLTLLASMGVDVPVKTVTDVLRIAVGLSGGDVSLPAVPPKKIRPSKWSKETADNPEREKFKFKSFTRAERNYLMSLLEKTSCNPKEAVLQKNRWIRLGEKIHPGEFTKKYPKSASMFSALRNTKVRSWYSEVEDAFKKSAKDGIKKLSERPGEFMRKLDWMLRTYIPEHKLIFNTMRDISGKVSNKVMFENLNHFEGRMVETSRSITIKGKRTPVALSSLPPFTTKIVDKVRDTVKESLALKFKALPSLGKVWIDEQLKNIPLPSNMRSASDSVIAYVRGQRLPLNTKDDKILRFYVHWFDRHGREDIDLTAVFFGKDRQIVMGWNGIKKSVCGCYSGDVRMREGACAEYIDINIEKALTNKFQYVIIDARNYQGRAMNTMEECSVGWMERDSMSSSLTFKPDTVANAIRLQSDSSSTVVGIIDLCAKELIFLDIDQNGVPVASANLNKHANLIKLYTEAPTFSVYDLLKLHTDARGTLVDDVLDADTVFNYDDFSSSYTKTLEYMGV